MKKKFSRSIDELKAIRLKLFEKFIRSLKDVYNRKTLSVNDIKLIIERDNITYLKDL